MTTLTQRDRELLSQFRQRQQEAAKAVVLQSPFEFCGPCRDYYYYIWFWKNDDVQLQFLRSSLAENQDIASIKAIERRIAELHNVERLSYGMPPVYVDRTESTFAALVSAHREHWSDDNLNLWLRPPARFGA